MTPLYKHMLHRDRPTLALVGVPYTTVPFIIFHYQVRAECSAARRGGSPATVDSVVSKC